MSETHTPATSTLLAGRRVVITGGARGIGLTVGERFVAEGAAVVLADVDGGTAEREAERLCATAGAGRAYGARVDVTDEESVAALAGHAVATMGGVDVLVANAGILVLAPAVDIAPDAWRRVVDVNLTGAFLTSREFGRRMIEQGTGGRVIMSSSLYGLRGGRDNAAYSATKFGMIGLAQCLAAEWAPHGILVNSVCPGNVDTAMIRQLFADRAASRGTSPGAVRDELVAKIPLGRLADPREVADIYVFLACDLARYVTGQALTVDGGVQVS
jgi:NAD(P)-dependent dehydrogenase (short-subunit alcohol dehydrogenase family)